MKRSTSTLIAVAGALLLAATGFTTGCSKNNSTGPSSSTTLRGKLLSRAGAARFAAPAGAETTGAPIAGAQVIVDGVPSGVFTDAGGEFTLTLEPGTHTVAVDAGGVSSSITVVVDGTTAMVVEFELEGGVLTTHEDVDDDGDIDSDDDIDDDGDVDDDDADGDIDDDGDIDVDIDGDGDVDDDDRDGDRDDDGVDDVTDASPDGIDDEA